MTFENIVVRAQANPQLTGAAINGTALACLRFTDSVSVETTVNGGQVAGSLTGSGFGVIMPTIYNQAVSQQTGDMQITGFPNGLSYGEHFTSENLLIQGCTTGITPQSLMAEGHSVKFNRCLIQGCLDAIVGPGSAARISGFFDVGDGAGPVGGQALRYFVNDSSNLLQGTVEVAVVRYSGGDSAQLGVSMNGGGNLNILPYVGRRSEWPIDTFTRLAYGVETGSSGTTDLTAHAYRLANDGTFPSGTTASMFTSALNSMTNNGAGNWGGKYLKYQTARAGSSRVVRAVINTWSGAYSFGIMLGKVVSGANLGYHLVVAVSGGKVTLYKQYGGTQLQLAASAASFVGASTAYTIDCIVNNPPGGTPSVAAIVNGTTALTAVVGSGTITNGVYQLTAAEATNLADTEQRYTQDGYWWYHDTGTVLSEFSIGPL